MSGPKNEVALIVLGARLLKSGLPNSVGRARMERGVELFSRMHPGCRVLICGGCSAGAASGLPSEAEALRDWGLNFALTRYGEELSSSLEEAILLECESLSTFENARAAADMMLESGLTEALLVTDPLHSLRALIVFRQIFKRHGLKVQPAPAWGVLKRFTSQGNYKAAARWAGREFLALVKLFAYDLPLGRYRRVDP